MGRSKTCLGNSNPNWEWSCPSLGNFSPTLGNFSPTLGNSSPSLGNSSPSLGNSSPSLGNSIPSLGNSNPCWFCSSPSRDYSKRKRFCLSSRRRKSKTFLNKMSEILSEKIIGKLFHDHLRLDNGIRFLEKKQVNTLGNIGQADLDFVLPYPRGTSIINDNSTRNIEQTQSIIFFFIG